jgi:hypothetical protein
MAELVEHPILGVGVIRKFLPTERFRFDFQTYEIFMCDDETGAFQQAVMAVVIRELKEAQALLGAIQNEPQFKGKKLFIAEIHRTAISGNFAPSLIKRRQQPDLLS